MTDEEHAQRVRARKIRAFVRGLRASVFTVGQLETISRSLGSGGTHDIECILVELGYDIDDILTGDLQRGQ